MFSFKKVRPHYKVEVHQKNRKHKSSKFLCDIFVKQEVGLLGILNSFCNTGRDKNQN